MSIPEVGNTEMSRIPRDVCNNEIKKSETILNNGICNENFIIVANLIRVI